MPKFFLLQQPFLLLLFVCFFLPYSLFSQDMDIQSSVVKVESEYATGSGIIIDCLPGEVYIITAKHVVTDEENYDAPPNVKVSFFEYSSAISAEIKYIDPVLDLAVLRIPLNGTINYHFDKLAKAIKKIRKKANLVKIKNKNKKPDLKVIGILSNGSWRTRNVENDIMFVPPLLKYGSGQLEEGFSGGPLLNRKNNQLLGMNITKEPHTDVALSIDHIIKVLERLGIPHKLLKNPSGVTDLTKHTALSSILTTGSGYVFHKLEQKNYNRYKTYRDPVAFEKTYPGTREGAYQKAKNFKTLEYVSYGVATACLAIAVIDHIRYKQGKKEVNKWNLSYVNSFGLPSDFLLDGHVITFTLNF